MSLRLRNVQLDVPPAAYDEAVAFWAAALGATTRGGEGPFTQLLDVAAPVGVHLQRLGDGAARAHLDLEADDPGAEVARLVDLGATVAWTGEGGPVLRDPAGLLACVGRTGDLRERLGAADPGRVHVELVVLDVPRDRLEATVRFWTAALGARAHPVAAPLDAFTVLAGVPGPDGPATLLVQDLGDGADARLHLDLHVPTTADRDREVARLEALGATTVAAVRHWRTLAAPGGHLLCVVPDQLPDRPADEATP